MFVSMHRNGTEDVYEFGISITERPSPWADPIFEVNEFSPVKLDRVNVETHLACLLSIVVPLYWADWFIGLERNHMDLSYIVTCNMGHDFRVSRRTQTFYLPAEPDFLKQELYLIFLLINKRLERDLVRLPEARIDLKKVERALSVQGE